MSCKLWSYWTEVHEIFTQYTGVIYAVNAHIVLHIPFLNARATKVGSLLGEKIAKIGPADPEIIVL